MSDQDDDLFADSDESGDTDDLIAESKQKPIAKPKKKKILKKKKASSGGGNKRKRIPDADNDSDDDDGPGLFDSDSEEDVEGKKSGAKVADYRHEAKKKPMSKRERMDALRAKKRQVVNSVPGSSQSGDAKQGDDDEDSYNSAEYIRTKEDLDFIDTEGDDADAVAELYAEQNFEDEREAMEDSGEGKKKMKAAGSSAYRGRSERAILEAEADEDDPVLQAVNKLKSKKKVQKKYSELEEEAKPFLAKMEQAADDDEQAISQKRPALKKLVMIDEVCETLARRDMQRPLLDQDLLTICKRWIQPLSNGHLGNITVRQRLLGAIAIMTGENGITASDLKRSDFGKVVMSLYMHKSETNTMKRKLRSLIDQWSRPIFQKSGNMRDLERVHHSRGDGGLSQISRRHMMEEQSRERALKAPVKRGHRGGKDQDLNSLIQSGAKGKTESGINRVRIPYSKGFQYSVRPENRITGDMDKRRDTTAGPSQDSRGKLSKRMVEKGRAKSKNQRSANISVEGRNTK
ncbi:IWS1_C-domain-containing protein [Fragilariopsis cylindrus CCMP1102]|uniref:IWS1_C-domain-containing protein n=1 Tax=Fragilariopsis cylindrus CCMP1102 TaxID=635003 RepID=A0A1E7FVW4_9STRA|nr:IWS1_C-domain-containing protein [Fragilariopsis cylindrus CCMP1102]|eukprot:OEU22286.1 IWS1_C-domain-containing protein [Fragilariopsis cylindrus CCMP1102]